MSWKTGVFNREDAAVVVKTLFDRDAPFTVIPFAKPGSAGCSIAYPADHDEAIAQHLSECGEVEADEPPPGFKDSMGNEY